MAETPNTVHGRLLEAVHISGYSFERACSELEWLLDENRWRDIGYADGAAFVESIFNLFAGFRISVEQRKPLAKKLSLIANQRAVAKVLGVDVATVNRDLKPVANATMAREPVAESGPSELPTAANATPAWFQGVDPSDLAKQASRPERLEARRIERIERLVEISKGNAPLVADRKYPIIYADPAWRYENPPMGGGNRSIENHYPTLTLEEIRLLPVLDLATEDAVLFLWATAPKLPECFEVISAWGFEYRTCAVWVKDKIGMGYYLRNQHELLLIAKRGSPPMPHESDRESSVIVAARAEHSAKPVEFYQLIETMYPELPKIELFSRAARDGWASWGNQAGEAAA